MEVERKSEAPTPALDVVRIARRAPVPNARCQKRARPKVPARWSLYILMGRSPVQTFKDYSAPRIVGLTTAK